MKNNPLTNPVIKSDIEKILKNGLSWDRYKGSTVLITGASGMIPSYLVYSFLAMNDLLGLGIRVYALVRNRPKAENIFGDLLARKDFHMLVQDVCDPITIDGPVDYIIHGASAARPALHKAEPTATIKANLMGTFNLLDMAVNKQSEQFLFMSSSEIYGKVPEDTGLLDEDTYGGFDILNPRSCYSEGKRAAETICAAYHSQFSLDCKIARLAHIYGPGMSLDDGRVQADFASDVIAGRDIVLNSDGSAVRTYTYVGDAVSGILYIMGKGSKMAYNVADESGMISIRELAEGFAAVRPEKNIKVSFNISVNPNASYNPVKTIVLSSKALRELGWAPRTGIQQGIDNMISYYEHLDRLF